MAHRTVLCARALLSAADGVANNEIALRVNGNPNSVRMWRQRLGKSHAKRPRPR
jgi:transposase-like protein